MYKMYKPTNREWAWAMYDFGNSAYALIVMTIFFPLFFAEYVVSGKLTATLWGSTVAISILLVGLISPLLGAFTDQEAKRKSYFVLFSIIAIIGTMLLPFTAHTPSYLGILIFVLVNSSFGLSLSVRFFYRCSSSGEERIDYAIGHWLGNWVFGRTFVSSDCMVLNGREIARRSFGLQNIVSCYRVLFLCLFYMALPFSA